MGRAVTVAVAALVAAGAAVAAVVATDRESPTLPAAANRLPAVTLSAYLTQRPLALGAACPATRPGGAELPGAVRRQLGNSRHAFGSAPIWVLLQPFPPVRLRSGHIYLKLGLVVSGSGTIRIVGKPLDGGPGRVWSDAPQGDQSGPPHVVVTSLTVSHPGCWDVAAVFRGNAVQWVYEAVPRPS